jgi:hypothetical protein
MAQKETIKEARRRVYEMRKAGIDWPAIATIMDKREPTVRDYYAKAVAIDGLPLLEPISANTLENRDPMVFGDFLAAAAEQQAAMAVSQSTAPVRDKYAALRDAAAELGMPVKAVNAFIKRLETRFAPVYDEAKRLSTAGIIEELDKKLVMALAYIDDHVFAKAELKDVMIATDIIIRNRQLLSGLPTANLDITARMKIHELLPVLIKEAGRRGITIENPPQIAFDTSPAMPVEMPAPIAEPVTIQQEAI